LLQDELMPNGKPGDHPITDIVVHNKRVFSRTADALIAEIVELGAQRELESSFNFFQPPATPLLEVRLKELRDRIVTERKETER
jgi:hypothetical protein